MQTSVSFPKIIDLNIGGTCFTTSLATLQSCPNSMLAAMFSGRHFVEKDSSNRYFIDRSGLTFEHILNWLRDRSVPSASALSQEKIACLQADAEYYGLEEMVAALKKTHIKTQFRVLAFNTQYAKETNHISEILTALGDDGWQLVSTSSAAANSIYMFAVLSKNV